jgi:iron complex outermembrane recepter protein
MDVDAYESAGKLTGSTTSVMVETKNEGGSMIGKISRCFVLTTALATIVATARAQSLEEVVVTAERRETSLQQTPLSIQAFTSEALEEKGVDTLQDVTAFSPNFEIKGARGQGNNTPVFMIRGISSGGAATSERSVGLYVDGVPMPRSQGSLLSVVDIDRIEVLKGPQGTLFGRNSTGGAVRIFTRQPGPEQEAYVKVTGGNFDRYDVSAMVNVPVSDTVFIRGQAGYQHEDGYVQKGPQKLGGGEEIFGRVQAKFAPGEAFAATLTYAYTRSDRTGSPLDNFGFDIAPGMINGNHADWLSDALVAANQAPLGQNDPRILLDDFTAPDYCLIDDFNPDWDNACRLHDDTRTRTTIANLVWTLNDRMSLTSLSGYSDLENSNIGDWQGWGIELRPDDLTSELLYQELLFNSSWFGGRLDLVNGATYYREKTFEHTWTITRRSTSSFAFVGTPPNLVAAPMAGTPPNADAGLFRTADNETREESNSWGVFSSGTLHFPQELNLTLGVRYSSDNKEIAATEFASRNFTPVPGTDRTTLQTEDDFNAVDWRVTLDKRFGDAFMVYGTVSRAYRAGSFTGIDVVSATAPAFAQTGAAQSAAARAVPPEHVLNRELGFRTEWFDGRLRFNATRFSMKYTDRQAARQVMTPNENPPLFFRIAVVSSGDVNIRGWEFDGQWAPLDTLVFDASAGLIDYRVLDPVANSGPFLFPEPASSSYSLGGRYTVPLLDGGVTFGLNYAWQAKQQTHPSIGTDSAYEQPAYGLLNGRLRYAPDSSRWEVALYANNLTDKTYTTFSNRFGGGFFDAGGGAAEADPITSPQRSGFGAIRGRPREYGLTFRYNF